MITSVYLYKYREKVLITWNRSEDQLHTLLDIANTQFPQHIWNITCIGTQTHFMHVKFYHFNKNTQITSSFLLYC
jgi:hypothetical protein